MPEAVTVSERVQNFIVCGHVNTVSQFPEVREQLFKPNSCYLLYTVCEHATVKPSVSLIIR